MTGQDRPLGPPEVGPVRRAYADEPTIDVQALADRVLLGLVHQPSVVAVEPDELRALAAAALDRDRWQTRALAAEGSTDGAAWDRLERERDVARADLSRLAAHMMRMWAASEQYCRECRDEREWLAPGVPAAFILWGKLFPQEALGPRCYDHAARWLGRGIDQVDQHAVFDLRPLRVPEENSEDMEGVRRDQRMDGAE